METFKEWELVEVSSDGKDWNVYKHIYLTTVPWKAVGKYILVHHNYEEEYKKWEVYEWTYWKYIRKLPPKKTITIEATPEQEKAINKILWTT